MPARLPFIFFVFLNLVVGMTAGLMRLGWNFDVGPIAVHHGAIMVGSFLGTLILLEKVIAQKNKILLALPAINALGIVMVVPGLYSVGLGLLLAGALGLFMVFVLYFKKQPNDLSLMLMTAGACCQVVGHIMLISKQFYPMAFPWWMGFILLVIVGERVELSKFLPVTKQNKQVLLGVLTFFVIGLMLPFHSVGKYVSGVALAGVGLWLLRYDIISIGLKKEGLTRFSARALMTGCIALVLVGVFLVALPDLVYADAIVHTFFLGFAFSMIFAHGPMILPGVLGLRVTPYHAILYIPLATLLISLLLRILSDVILFSPGLRLWSGWLSACSILGYFIILAGIMMTKVRHAKAV
ncbi:hypothetical protein SAMN04488109_2989 [Chryseolinea serpens]|uniref:NnrS protein n=1 Tax=Chryseolinea serpens TaxID=947013 RepID=A0A1M5QTW1_9BACT|nr:hypothetical protein [Chryseolinea serpens]SHH17033.1 hypothetical protein SAMN04488109_2989 [Chryseolinea serpens]